ncbi:MAG TPA: hypothetical protein VE954_33950 [Oligoflexus sp.]|uniref:hypothetical protein n=1 Tax=Oligoflexus sp. TaxID=1971216 RepID=UPI002D36006C|nr:hypothetical protein [Oligoflexus sp.]HYX38131.1 hypothetical protein [Oligoflexus sp.]
MPDLRFKAFGLLWIALSSVSASAEIMAPLLPAKSVGFGLSTLHVELPDSDSEQRYRWDLHEYMRLPYGLRLHNRLGVARDTRPRADSLGVHHHFYELASNLQWTTTHLFRYGIGAGPLLLLEQTITRVQLSETQNRTNNRLQLGGMVEAQLDYAFHSAWELGLMAAIQFRPAVQKQDFSFGVSINFNPSNVRKDDTTKPRMPGPAQVSPH